MLILTEVNKKLFDFLTEKPRTTSEIVKFMGYKYAKSAHQRLGKLKQAGIKIEGRKLSSRADFTYSIKETANIEEAPFFKKEFKDDNEFGKQLYQDVKNLSNTLTSENLEERPSFKFKEAIGIIYLSDFHLGIPHALYDYIEKLVKIIANTKNLLVVGLGDLIDNSVNLKAPDGAVNDVDKYGQMAMLQYLLNMIKDRILVLFEGNHEARSYITDHFLINKYLAEKYLARYGKYGGAIDIDMNGIPIKIYCRHYGRGHSQYHPFQPNIRYVLFEQAPEAYDADIIVSAHFHESGVGEWRLGHKVRQSIVCGFAGIYHEWADRKDFYPQPYNFPITIIREDGSFFSTRNTQLGIDILNLLVK